MEVIFVKGEMAVFSKYVTIKGGGTCCELSKNESEIEQELFT
jgi:hypothetical protein